MYGTLARSLVAAFVAACVLCVGAGAAGTRIIARHAPAPASGVWAIAPTRVAVPDSKENSVVSGSACAAAVRSSCGHVKPPAGSVIRCLERNEELLAPDCRRQLNDLRGAGTARIKAACTDDAVALCPGMAADPTGFERCIIERIDRLSPGCRSALDTVEARACYSDVERVCSNDVEVTAPLRQCIETNRAALATSCRPLGL